MVKRNLFHLLILLTFFVSGCATTSYPPAIPQRQLPQISGIYHKVEKGQTLWRIAKTYDIELEKIVEYNRLPDMTNIYPGQLLFIPGVKEKLPIPPFQASTKREEDFIWPLKGKIITKFGSKKEGTINKGIDIEAKPGQEVVAAKSGEVSFCSENFKGYGKTIIIDHLNGYSTVYAHNSKIFVNVGDYVKQGEVIAIAGSTGRANQVYLHFQIRKGYKSQNPFFYLP